MNPTLCSALLGALLLTGCVTAPEAAPPAVPAGKTVLVPGNALYSAAVGYGDTVYLAGVIGRSETGDVSEAARQAMDAVKGNIEKAGGTMGDLLKCTIFMTDIEQYGPVNEVYADYFEADPPARTAIAVSALPFGALVEVECIAAR
ncbi:putative Endoribonuclease L-PSP [Hyphomonas neptunium ATCC 15444]|uniref:Putative Endoribonuclease L-PSP n=2 Tax=Hyphomonas TaxID=85 RepID=Q0C4Z8_HYPNA|nr:MULTISPECIES: RidA family protein [Hyphomonas]ABI76775.1 putative Endoribonuclease L-PSP [Hyphomonas neptunium ATCC 15444]KCZ95628.1 putative endoribonuclease L-PSP [Hyphomonas hirschiana VP5]